MLLNLLPAPALLSLAALTWAGNYIAGRLIAGEVPPGGLAVLRWTLALLVLLPLARPHLARDLPAIAKAWRVVLLLGVTGGAMFGTLQYGGLQFTSVINGGLISATSPVMIALAGAVLFGDRLPPRLWAGLALSLSGALVIVMRGDPANLAGLRLNIGDLMLLATLASWSIYCALLRRKPSAHWTTFTLVVFVIALVGNIPVAIIEHLAGFPLKASRFTWGAVLYTGLVSSVIGYAVWNKGVEMIGSPRAGLYLNLIPVLSVGLAYLLLGERLAPYHLVACLLVVAGIWLASGAGPAREA